MKKQDGEFKEVYYPPLPLIEVLHYLGIYALVILWSIATLLPISRSKELKYVGYGYLESGWRSWIGHHKDISDFEWSFWEKYFCPVIGIGLSGHFVTARIADVVWPNHRFKLYCVYSAIFTTYFLGFHGLLFLLIHFAVQYVIALLTKSVVACWTCGCILAYSLTNSRCISVLKSFYPEDEYKAYFVLFTAAMCNLRYISFSIEYVWHVQSISNPTFVECSNDDACHLIIKDSKRNESNAEQSEKSAVRKLQPHHGAECRNKFTFIDMLVYQMYYPLFYGGPVMNYNEFSCQISRSVALWDFSRTTKFIFGILRFLFWHFITNILLHFFYVPAISSDFRVVMKLPLISLLGLGLGLVLFFCLKYVGMYGLASSFCIADELNVPGPPHCIFVKHRVTDMWKYFDKGLHLWLVRYIYVPCGGSRVSTGRSLINSMLPFLFVYFWHGFTHGQWYWACFSWLGVYIESVALKLYNMAEVKALEAKYCSPSGSRRLRAVLSAPLLSLLLTSNLFFLCSVDIAWLYFKRLYLENFFFTFMTLIFFYCGCQTSMEFNRMGI